MGQLLSHQQFKIHLSLQCGLEVKVIELYTNVVYHHPQRWILQQNSCGGVLLASVIACHTLLQDAQDVDGPYSAIYIYS